MIDIYELENKDVYGALKRLLSRYIPAPIAISRTEKGKPFIEGNPLYFSISHSQNSAVIAVASRPVGIDIELVGGKKFERVLARFSERERRYIGNSALKFCENWTAKEAYVKMNGGSIFEELDRLEFYDGKITENGEDKTCAVKGFYRGESVVTVCAQLPREEVSKAEFLHI